MSDIKFYSVHQTYGEFSNFSHHSITVKGIKYPTVEHFFQSNKFKGTKHELKIIKARSPMQAAELGRTRRVKINQNWDRKKDNVMLEGVLSKFEQHPELAKTLLETQNLRIIEHTENDSYWGDGGDGTGLNKLGKILMRVRDILKEKEI